MSESPFISLGRRSSFPGLVKVAAEKQAPMEILVALSQKGEITERFLWMRSERTPSYVSVSQPIINKEFPALYTPCESNHRLEIILPLFLFISFVKLFTSCSGEFVLRIFIRLLNRAEKPVLVFIRKVAILNRFEREKTKRLMRFAVALFLFTLSVVDTILCVLS